MKGTKTIDFWQTKLFYMCIIHSEYIYHAKKIDPRWTIGISINNDIIISLINNLKQSLIYTSNGEF